MFRSSSVGQRPTSSVPLGTRSQLQNGAVQRGLGALPSTSKMDASPGGGASIFGMMGPSCPACPFLRPSLSIIPQLFRLLSSTKTISGRLLKRIGIMLFPRPRLTTMFVPPPV